MLDYHRAKGLLVKYSDHYRKQHPGQDWAVVKDRIGVVTDVKSFIEGGVMVSYPVVEWEGGTSSMCHPLNVKPYRKGVKLPTLASG